jgi:hypothetical protein
MKLSIIAIAHHRNGICGAPFAVVLFEDGGPEESRKNRTIARFSTSPSSRRATSPS